MFLAYCVASSKETFVDVKCFVNYKTLCKYETVLMYILSVPKWFIIAVLFLRPSSHGNLQIS